MPTDGDPISRAIHTDGDPMSMMGEDSPCISPRSKRAAIIVAVHISI
jgi:hypothetical protein